MRTVYSLLAIFIAVLLSGCNLEEPLSVTVVHVNDTHSSFEEQIKQVGLPDESGNLSPTYAYVGGFSRLASYVDIAREESTLEDRDLLLLHGGDAFTGSLYFTLYKGTLNAGLMNVMEFDAMVIGNHEFDLGNEKLAEFSDLVDFPLVSANLKTRQGDDLHERYLPFTIKMVGPKKQPLAIVGLTTPYTALISSPSDSTSFEDAITAASRTVKHLEDLGLNKIIFLTHQGLEEDRALAKSVSGIDVIIGGHSHTLLGDHSNIGLPIEHPSPVWESSPDGEPVCIMQSGEKSLVVGNTKVDFSGPGRVESCNGQNIFLLGEVFASGTPPAPVNSERYSNIVDFINTASNLMIVPPDPAVAAILESAKQEVNTFAESLVGTASSPLYHVRLPGERHPSSAILPNGSQVAPHVASSMVYKMEATSGQRYIGIMNAGGVRSDLADTITVGDAYTTVPFASTLVTMAITGDSVVASLQNAVSNAYGISGVTFPYVANIRYTIDVQALGGPQVFGVEILNEDGVFESANPNQVYNLVTTSYLASGGDGYMFSDAQDMVDTGHIDADALIEYIEGSGGVIGELASNITLVP